jgi:hypothetical protein
MRTQRRHRLTRRQSEQVLDGLGPRDDLSRLLAAARPLRANGELPGEAVAAAAFRSAAVAHLDPRPRSSSVRTLPLRRSLAVKIGSVAAASLAVGGVSMAATGHLPGRLKAAPVASTSSHPTVKPTVVEDGTGDSDSPSGDQAHPTGFPTGQPGHRADSIHAIGLCRAWSEIAKNDATALTRSNRFAELVGVAGGAALVPAFCDEQTAVWCESHRWPGAAPVQIDGRPIMMRCVKPTGQPTDHPADHPTNHPTGALTGGMPGGGPGKGGQPTHQGGGKPPSLPTGAPVRN